MLRATQRLRRRTDFDRVVRGGVRARRDGLVVHLARRYAGEPAQVGLNPDEAEVSRMGLVVPRAVGSAVVRNLLRRRLRQLARQHLGSLPWKCDLVIRVDHSAAARSYQDLGRDLTAALAAATATARRTTTGDHGGAP